MKALTICQPYADMIAKGEKIIENRKWPAPAKLIGQRIAIHAGKSRSWMDPEDLKERPDMVFGAVIATAELVACLHLDKLPPHLLSRDDANGPWCWLLDKVEVLPRPVPVNGALGLWEWHDEAVPA